MRYFSKVAEEETKSKLLKYVAAPAAVGALTYAAVRHPQFSKIPAIAKAQKASKGKVTSIVSGKPEVMMRDFNVEALVNPSTPAKMKNWLLHAGIKHVRAEDLQKIKGKVKIKGAVYDDVAMTHPTWDPSKVKADVRYNVNKSEFLNRLQEKHVFSQMPEFKEFTPKAELLSKIIPKGKHTRESLHKALKDKDVFIKVKSGEGFGHGFQGKPADILKASDKDFKHLIENRGNYIAQDFFKHDKEYRVHAILQGGKVSITESHLKGLKGKHVLGKSINTPKVDPELAEYTKKALSEYAAKNKDKGNMIFGVDVMRDTKARKFAIGEINDNSGSFRTYIANYVRGKKNVEPRLLDKGKPPLFLKSPYLNYRQLTGQHAQPVAAGAGVVSAAATASVLKIKDEMKKTSEEKKSKFGLATLREHKVLTGIGVSALTTAALYKGLRAPKFSTDPYLRKIQKASKGKVTLVDPDLYASAELARLGEATHPIVQRVAEKSLSLFDETAGAIIRKIRFPGIKTVDPEKLKKGTKLEGVVVNRAAGTGKHITGDITVNPERTHYTKRDPIFNEKLKVGDIEEFKTIMPKTHDFEKLLKEHADISVEDFSKLRRSGAAKVLRKVDTGAGGVFVKPRYGERSEGLYSRLSQVTKAPITAKKYPENPIAEIQKEHKKLLFQEHLPIKVESRIHTLGSKIIGPPQTRHLTDVIKGKQTKNLPKDFKEEIETRLAVVLKKNKLDDPKEPPMLGWDIAKTTAGDYKVIEANTNSGFVFNMPPYARNKEMYTALTGRKSVAEAVGKTLPVSALAGTTAAYALHKTGEDRTDAMPTAVTAAAVAIPTYFASKYYLGKKYSKEFAELSNKYVKGFKKSTKATKAEMQRIHEQFFKGSEQKVLENNKKELIIGGGLGLATGGALAYKFPGDIIKEVKRKAGAAESKSVGRINVSTKSLVGKPFQPTGEIESVAKGERTLGALLRKSGKRMILGDDSELQVLGTKGSRVYAQNTFGTDAEHAIKGLNYKIVKDPTVGGLELNVAPGDADQLHRRFKRAITEGAPQAITSEGAILSGNTFLKTTGKGDIAASTHIHFQAKPELMKSKVNRVVGATAALNYLVPGAEERARGYSAYGAVNPKQKFGAGLPNATFWTAEGEKDLLGKHGFKHHPKKRAWRPDVGNIATEVRFNAPMHGDPKLSKKYLQLAELSLGESEHAVKFERLGKKIQRTTRGENVKLHSPKVKRMVVKEFESIIKSMPMEDKAINSMIQMMHRGKQLKLGNVVEAWKKFR